MILTLPRPVATVNDCDVAYPGHPVVIAWFITEAYPDFETVRQLGGRRLLESVDLPGTGGTIQAALELLGMLRSGLSFERVMAAGDRQWHEFTDFKGWQVDRRIAGQVQAEILKPLLRRKKSWWAKASLVSVG